MTDIGFGLINRRTVIVALFCMVISVSLLNNSLPINTASVGDLFISIVLFTGYLIVLRSVYLLPLAILFSIIYGYDGVNSYVKRILPKIEYEGRLWYFLKMGFIGIIRVFISVVLMLLLLPLYIFSFGKWSDNRMHYEFGIENFNSVITNDRAFAGDSQLALKRFIRFFDRAGLICIIVLSTFPIMNPLVKPIGEIGLILSTIIFLIRGDFSFIVKDSIGEKDVPVDNLN